MYYLFNFSVIAAKDLQDFLICCIKNVPNRDCSVKKLRFCIFQGSSSSQTLLQQISGITAESGNSGIIQQLSFGLSRQETRTCPDSCESDLRMPSWKAFNHSFPFVWQELLSEIWPSPLFHVESSFECLPAAGCPWRADSFLSVFMKAGPPWPNTTLAATWLRSKLVTTDRQFSVWTRILHWKVMQTD